MHLYFHKINTTPDNTVQYMTALQRRGWQKWTGIIPTKECIGNHIITLALIATMSVDADVSVNQ